MAFSWKDKPDLFRGEGIYHLTFVIHNRVPLLGRLCPNAQPSAAGQRAQPFASTQQVQPSVATCIPPTYHLAHVAASELGRAVSQQFTALTVRFPEMQILAKQIMPDHFHAVVWMRQGFQGSIKMVARGFSQGCSKAARQLAQSAHSPSYPPFLQAQSNCANNDSEASKSSHTPASTAATASSHTPASTGAPASTAATVSSLASASTAAPPFRQPHDASHSLPPASIYDCGNGANTLFATPYIRTLSHAGQLQSMISYVHANPDNAWQRHLHPDLYVIRRNVTYAGLRFDAMGKAHLLDWPDRQVIALSRSLSQEQIQAEVGQALRMAQSGTVTYTAAINTAEKAVSHAIRTHHCPLVVLLLDGFPPEGTEAARHYHPQGVYHQACGAGLLYLLAPSATNYDDPRLISLTDEELQRKAQSKGYHYTPLPHTSKRWRMIAGNVMLRMLAGEI